MPTNSRNWRWARWTVVGSILLVPAVAMQFTTEVQWDLADFLVAGGLLGGVVLAYEFATGPAVSAVYRSGAAVALVASLLLVWVNAAVGILGSEANAANLLYLAVVLMGPAGAALCHLRPSGMARTCAAMAASLIGIAALAITARWGEPLQLLTLHGGFVTLFGTAAVLFDRAAHSGPNGKLSAETVTS